MMEMIAKQAAIDILEVAINDDWEFDYAKDRMIELSTHPEIIKCKDCTWCQNDTVHGKVFCSREGAMDWIEPDSYCSYGERETDGSD